MNAAQLRRQALQAHASGSWQLAEEAYLQLLKLQPSADMAANYGGLLRTCGRLADAEAHYQRALQAFPHDPQLLCNACNLLRDQGKAEATLPLLQEALTHHPGHVEAQWLMSWILHGVPPSNSIQCYEGVSGETKKQ